MRFPEPSKPIKKRRGRIKYRICGNAGEPAIKGKDICIVKIRKAAILRMTAWIFLCQLTATAFSVGASPFFLTLLKKTIKQIRWARKVIPHVTG